MPTTIHDVAKRLKISITTVSRALDGYDDVAASTRELVIRTAQEMGYSPNRAARQLRRRKAETVGFILPANAQRFDEPYFTEFISGLGDALSGQKFDLLVANAKSEEMEKSLYQRWIHSRKVDGIVLNRVQRKDWRVQYLSSVNFPFTALGKSQDGINYSHIQVDASQGYIDLLSHIREGGFFRPAFIGGQTDLINHTDRLKWFKSAVKVAGMSLDEELLILADMTSSGGYEAAQRLLSMPKPPDALICINDETAFGALHAVHDNRLAVGSQVAVAGFDGVQDSAHTEPPLTTLDIPVPEIARQLAGMLLKIINGEQLDASRIVIRPNLQIRASTGDTNI